MVNEESPHKDLMFRIEYCLQDLRDLAALEEISKVQREKLLPIAADGRAMHGLLVGAHEKKIEVPGSALVGMDRWCDWVEAMMGRVAEAAAA